MLEKLLTPQAKIPPFSSELYKQMSHDAGKDVSIFISGNISIHHEKSVLYFPEKGANIHDVDYSNIRSIVDLRRINDVKDINKNLISINKLLPDAGMFIGRFESYFNRKYKIFKRFGNRTGWIIWGIDLLFNRILPKVKFTGEIYKIVTGNKHKVISLAETLGRCVYCGFEIIDFKIMGNLTYFCVIKTSEPKNDSYPSYGPLFKMRRIGKNGKIIGVYKFRTMHPYSEYIQSFVLNLNGYNEYGKIKNDFRVTGWSKIVRKLYLDELPQLLNVIKGEMNLVGVRPLSMVGYNYLPEDLKKERIKYKPGCIPPYVALRLKGLNGVLDAERIYLEEMKRSPLRTNIKYFFKAMINLALFRISSD